MRLLDDKWVVCSVFDWFVGGLWVVCLVFRWFVDGLGGLWVVWVICWWFEWFRVLQLTQKSKVLLN